MTPFRGRRLSAAVLTCATAVAVLATAQPDATAAARPAGSQPAGRSVGPGRAGHATTATAAGHSGSQRPASRAAGSGRHRGGRRAARPTRHAGHRRAPARSSGAALRNRLLADLSRGTASHVAFRADVDGLGRLALRPASRSAPASTMKLLTAQAALTRLGPAHRFRTTLGFTGTRVDAVVTGDLVVTGSGDPSLTSAALGRLAGDVARAGVTEVTGDLVVDDTLFEPRSWAPGWKASYVPDEVGPVDAFAVDENAARTDAAYVRDPATANGQLLAQLLTEANVHLRGTVRRGSPHADVTVVASAFSLPLSSLVANMLTSSDNFTAETLLDDLGAATGDGSDRGGIAEVARQCAALRCVPGVVHDGSGLSRTDAQSPDALVGWLRASAGSPVGPALYAGLPVACRTGTLRRRLCSAGVAGVVHAKTGTIEHVRTLAGYARTRSGRAVTFAIMVSGVRNMSAAQRAIDAAVTDLVLRG